MSLLGLCGLVGGVHVEDVGGQLPVLYLVGDIEHEVDEVEAGQKCGREVDVFYD